MSTPTTTALPATLQPGTVIAGKYKVERAIATGGMGAVLAATHATLGHPVAIKVMLPQAVAHAGAQDRFLREARAAAHLTSEHVVRVFDVGTLDDGLPFMVMEHLVGRDLSALLEERGPLPVKEVTGYLLQALDGLIEAHDAGVIHRDLKPSNLFLVERTGRIKILDFGISKIVSEAGPLSSADAVRTATTALFGSPAYMSPEQVRSTKNVERSADLWSVGVILFELLVGRALFAGDTFGEIFAQILQDPIPNVTSLRSDVPAELSDIVARCLDRDRDKRPTARELHDLLAPFASGSPRVPAVAERDAAPRESGSLVAARTLQAEAADAPETAVSAAKAAPAKSRATLAIAAAIGVVLVGLGGYLIARGGGPGPSAGALADSAPSSTGSAPVPSVVVIPSGTSGATSVTATAAASAPPTATATASASGAPTTKPTQKAGTGPTATVKTPKGINLNQRD
ncbi:MAG: serine/threonine-protein kinase [Polyangiaceae bacterium]